MITEQVLIPLDGPSISGLQAIELMGLTNNAINDLSDSDVQSFKDFYDKEIYKRAERRLLIDVQKMLSGFYRFDDGEFLMGRFDFNAKFQTILTSQFVPGVGSITPSIRVESHLSLYSTLVINYIEFVATQTSPNDQDIVVTITDHNTGLAAQKTVNQKILLGLNRINLYQVIPANWIDVSIGLDFPTSPTLIQLANTQQLLTSLSSLQSKGWCRCQCGTGWIGVYFEQPGINVSMVGICSIKRFIELNFPLFSLSLYYAIGLEFMKDRITSDRINQYTVLTIDRATQLLELYEKDYIAALQTIRDVRGIPEDWDCFECKKGLTSTNLLP